MDPNDPKPPFPEELKSVNSQEYNVRLFVLIASVSDANSLLGKADQDCPCLVYVLA